MECENIFVSCAHVYPVADCSGPNNNNGSSYLVSTSDHQISNHSVATGLGPKIDRNAENDAFRSINRNHETFAKKLKFVDHLKI